MSVIFQPTVWDWLFGNGIGTNLGASLIWVYVAGVSATFLWPPARRGFIRFMDRKIAPLHTHIVAIRLHAQHQSRIAEDHYQRAFGEKHPLHGAVDHLKIGADHDR